MVANHPDRRVILINHKVNKGVGGSMVSGYKKALELGVDIIVKLYGDGQMDPANIQKLVEPIRRGHADYTKGVRFRDSEIIRRMPTTRLIGNLGLSFLTKVASGYWNVFDPTNGFTAIGRTSLELISLEKISNDYFFESDMLARLYMIDAVVMDVPMKARYGDEISHLSLAKVFFSFPGRLLRALCRRIIWRYFIYDFNAFSIFFLSEWNLAIGIWFHLRHLRMDHVQLSCREKGCPYRNDHAGCHADYSGLSIIVTGDRSRYSKCSRHPPLP
jgi:glycosyltransferase involved in cell wall biosynthesis